MRTLSSVLTGSQRNSKAITTRRLLGAVGLTVILVGLEAVGAAQIPVLWTAGGLSAGNDSAGQAARIAADAAGNVAVVSGPAFARDLAVTSYTADGSFRWRGTVSPSIGTFKGDWVAAAPNGDFVAVGRNIIRWSTHRHHYGPLRVRWDTPVASGPGSHDSFGGATACR